MDMTETLVAACRYLEKLLLIASPKPLHVVQTDCYRLVTRLFTIVTWTVDKWENHSAGCV